MLFLNIHSQKRKFKEITQEADMRFYRYFKFSAFALLLTAVLTLSAAEGTATGNVNVRALPDASSQKISSVEKGAKVTVIAKTGEWYKIQLPDDFAVWVSRTLVDGNKIKVSSAANLRSDCQNNAPVLGKARNGAEFEIVDDSNKEWLKITFKPEAKVVLAGFVHSDYIKSDAAPEEKKETAKGPDIETLKKYFKNPKGKDVTISGMISPLEASERPLGLTHALWENRKGKLHFMGYVYFPKGDLKKFENKNIRVIAWQYEISDKNWPNVYEARKITER